MGCALVFLGLGIIVLYFEQDRRNVMDVQIKFELEVAITIEIIHNLIKKHTNFLIKTIVKGIM